jgi:XTP/dITP diphosphohydrolase
MKICFATNNAKKIEEVKAALGSNIEIVSLQDIGCFEELPETGDTLHHNAFQKARFVKDNYGVDCFADDTGLEVDSLNGAPGVYSGRYAGEPRSDERFWMEGNMLSKESHREKSSWKKLARVVLDTIRFSYPVGTPKHLPN